MHNVLIFLTVFWSVVQWTLLYVQLPSEFKSISEHVNKPDKVHWIMYTGLPKEEQNDPIQIFELFKWKALNCTVKNYIYCTENKF